MFVTTAALFVMIMIINTFVTNFLEHFHNVLCFVIPLDAGSDVLGWVMDDRSVIVTLLLNYLHKFHFCHILLLSYWTLHKYV